MNDTSILLLDAAWRIDRVIGAERAVELVLTGAVVAASDEIGCVMRSPSIEVPVPSVIARLGGIVSASSTPACSSANVRVRDRHACQFVVDGRPCDRRADSVDHLVPRSAGGRSSWTNLVGACRRHNQVKRNLLLADLGWALRRAPYIPSRHELVSARLRNAGRPEWAPFLAA